MGSAANIGKNFTVVCTNFTATEVDVTRSLLTLIEPYLKHHWTVATRGSGALYLVNLDSENDNRRDAQRDDKVVGCALRPRVHPPGTIHRPLRVSELLAVLSEAAGPANEQSAFASSTFKLRAWPSELQAIPEKWLRVMASIWRQPRSPSELATRTDASRADVERCLTFLMEKGLVERSVDTAPSPAATTVRNPWHRIVQRVAQALRLST